MAFSISAKHAKFSWTPCSYAVGAKWCATVEILAKLPIGVTISHYAEP